MAGQTRRTKYHYILVRFLCESNKLHISQSEALTETLPLSTNLRHVWITISVFFRQQFRQAGDSNHSLVSQRIVAYTLRTGVDKGVQVKTHALPEHVHVQQGLQHPYSTYMLLCTQK